MLETKIATLPEPTRDVEQGKRNLTEFGVTLHEDYVSPEVSAQLLTRLKEQAEMECEQGVAWTAGAGGVTARQIGRPEQDPVLQLVEFLPNKGQVFLDLAMNPIGRAYTDHVFRGQVFNVFTQDGLIVRKGSPRQPPHIDQMVLPAEMSTIPAVINIFLALTDVDSSMGATLIAPGTHLRGRPNYGVDEYSVEYFPAECKAGTAIIWEGRTWHGQGPTSSDKTRYVVTTTYSLHCVKPNANYPASLHDDVYETLSEDELQMLGFRLEMMGGSGRIVPRSATDRHMNFNWPDAYTPELRRNGAKRAIRV